MRRVVLVICDGLRADMVTHENTPNISRVAEQGTRFTQHRSVFPSTTRTTSASIATGCEPARHGLEGNCVALFEGGGLVAMSVGPPAFRDRLERATGRTLRVPTLAERLHDAGGSVVFSNVSPGAAIFQDPDGHGWVYHRSLSYGPGRNPVEPPDALTISHDAAGDACMTERFIDDVLSVRRPALAVLWQCEPDLTQHAAPLGSPEHLRSIGAADANVGRVVEFLGHDTQDEVLLMVASDHGHETVAGVVDLEAELVGAGFKEAVDSNDVVVASNGLSASIYLDDSLRQHIVSIAEFLDKDPRIGRVIFGDELVRVGHRTDSYLSLIVTGAYSRQVNSYGIPGQAYAFADVFSHDTGVGCGQHGGLGDYEQHPFLVIRGAMFGAGVIDDVPTSAVDLAPTILRHLGIAAQGMDGRTLQT